MGSNVAPPYANVYMSHVEEQFIYTNQLFEEHAIIWLRFIDDIFCIWGGHESTILEFNEFLNSIYPELGFTFHHSQTEVSYLDTRVKKDQTGLLKFDLYSKDTDRNSLLHFLHFSKKSFNSD